MRRAFALFVCFLLASLRALADDLPRRVPSDVFEGEYAAVLPTPPVGTVTRVVGPAEYVVPRHFVDDLEDLDRTRVEASARIANDLGVFTDEHVRIRIGRNEGEMRAMAPVDMPPPSYAAGVAYPGLGLVLLTLTTHNPGEPVPDVHRVLTHELSHVALHRAAGGRPLPRWFSEGMAIYHANENGMERIQTLWQAASQHRLLPIAQLNQGFADGSPDVDVAYAQSADVIGYLLRQHHGQDKMRRLLGSMRDGVEFEPALAHAFFIRVADLDREWRKDLGERHSNYPILLGGGGLWAVFFVVLAIGYVGRRRRSKNKLQQWANEEAAMASLEAELERKLHAAESRRNAEATAARSTSRDPSSPGGRSVPPPGTTGSTPASGTSTTQGGRTHTLH